MRTLFYPAFDQLEIRDVDLTPLRPDEVRVQVAACGICGSELETFKNHSPRRAPPIVMGHEFCGVIAETGADVRGWREGARVVSNSLVPCGRCVRCERGDTHLCAQRQIFGMHRPGAFADYVNVPARCLIPWPDNVPAEAAALAEPMANGLHVANLTRHLAVSTALVIGAGPIGLFCQQALQVVRGARVLVADLSPERLAVARKLGAARTINPREEDIVKVMQAETGGEGADLAVDAVGAGITKKASIEALRPGGGVVWIGLHENAMTLDSYAITLPERQVLGTYAAKIEELQQALDLMAAGKVDALSWVQRFPLEDGVTGFHRALAAKGNDIKVVIAP
ncbi:alcohol dehydrogenase catalytic domain-containing protein [Horticoccus luteus]|uniref:Alcohol dehydrogenase catalytic domain-containing protein n=1 Tax=Horticoccus luteus TaxID=2862869 RepID=A0A8F9TUT5_9BACT|nr:alcohol dehydrogenase catalytic domain-containing protein [Horticoccus luteus]QYM78688.1 alcohol dehydrogenase catalytic domain-containing protein [Horticoccus luteus]